MFTDLSNPSVFYFSIVREGNRRHRALLKRGDVIIATRSFGSNALAYDFGREWVEKQRAYRDMEDARR